MADNNPTPSLSQSLTGVNSRQSIGLLVALAALIALIMGMWMWWQTPDYRVLYGNLTDQDGGAIIEALQQLNVPYKFADGGGALMVPGDRVHEVRLRMASQGLPKSSLAGFELMENQKFGTSQFLEQMNYQRALEGELARSVQTLAAVQSARVHLAIPKPSVFVKEQQQPGASVVLRLHPGRNLDTGQVSGIVHLISSSVPNMPAKNVTVVDQSGSLLSSAKEGGAGQLDASQISFVRKIEQDYINRIEAIISPLVGANNVRAQVTADIDFAQIEQTAELYKPNQDPKDSAMRSKQSLDSTTGKGQNVAAGVPGALSNQPPVPATAPIVVPADAAATAPETGTATATGTIHRESTINYEVDRTISHTRLPVGNIKRLSVAVVLNNRTVTSKSGKISSKPLSEAEKLQITALVKDAMGFDEKRGDSLNVLNSAFNVEPEIPVVEIPFWKQTETLALAKDISKFLLIAGVLLFILFGIFLPALRSFMASLKQGGDRGAQHAGGEYEIPMGSSGTGKFGAAAQRLANSYEENLQTAKQIAQQNPKIVASVVQEWMNKS